MKELPVNPTLDELTAFFAEDQWAARGGCRILEGSAGHSVVEMPLGDIHRNAMGNVMGGAIFTLADFALAIACNVGSKPTVAVSNTIEFLNIPKGSVLTAICEEDKSGRKLGFYTVDITDDTELPIARMVATCYR